MPEKFLDVAVLGARMPGRGIFSYRVPAGAAVPAPGSLVRVPFGKISRRGVVVAVKNSAPGGIARDKIREISGEIFSRGVVGPAGLRLAAWLADFYFAPAGRVFEAILPAGVRKFKPAAEIFWEKIADPAAPPRGERQRRALELFDEKNPRAAGDFLAEKISPATLRSLEKSGILKKISRAVDPFFLGSEGGTRLPPGFPPSDGSAVADPASPLRGAAPAGETPATRGADRASGADLPTLTPAQKSALEICRAADPRPVLLRGVTGSGKTEIYLRLVADAVRAGKSAIVLVPEIMLSAEIAARFAARFPGKIAVLNSGQTPAERAAAWFSIARGEKSVVLGPRSALFAPVGLGGGGGFENPPLGENFDQKNPPDFLDPPAQDFFKKITAGCAPDPVGSRVIFSCGLPLSGKTTFFRALAARLGWVHLRSDAVAAALRPDDPAGSRSGLIEPILRALIERGFSVVVDRAFLRREPRESFIKNIREAGGDPLGAVVFVEPPAEEIARREAARAAAVQAGATEFFDPTIPRDFFVKKFENPGPEEPILAEVRTFGPDQNDEKILADLIKKFASAPAGKPLGLIVIDEEHDESYRQDAAPRYDARRAAAILARETGARLVLGSATPRLETLAGVRAGRVRLAELPERIGGAGLPRVRVVDLRGSPGGARDPGRWLFSETLRKKIAETLARGGQTFLLLNRRGLAPALFCPGCGWRARDPETETALAIHRGQRGNFLKNHETGRTFPVPEKCPKCGAENLTALGAGTEKAEEILREEFPGAAILVLTRDTAASAKSRLAALEKIRSGAAQIILGTQMIAQGFDFPAVETVGVLLADLGLAAPDFRAAERTFSLLTQIAGRAGRPKNGGGDFEKKSRRPEPEAKDLPGEISQKDPSPAPRTQDDGDFDAVKNFEKSEPEVIFQTFDPEHPAIQLAARHDAAGFAEIELRARARLSFPPAGEILRVGATGKNAEFLAKNLAEKLRRAGVRIDGPARGLGGIWEFLARGSGAAAALEKIWTGPAPAGFRVERE